MDVAYAPLVPAANSRDSIGGRDEATPRLEAASNGAPEREDSDGKSRRGSDASTSLREYMAVVQFSCAQYYSKEGFENEVSIDVVRLGDVSHGDVEFDFKTEDVSAKAGVKYKAVKGTMKFGPGEAMKTIKVPIINNDAWEATLEFKLVLTAVRGAKMGKYLNHCRVKIIDNDWFPTNKFAEEFSKRDISALEGIPGHWLMLEFCRLVRRDKMLWRKTLQCLFLDQLSGLYFFLTLYMQMYLVDVVLAYHSGEEAMAHTEAEAAEERRLLKQGVLAAGRFVARRLHGDVAEGGEGEGEEEENVGFMLETLLVPGSRKYTSMVVAAIYVLPFVFVHMADWLKCRIQLQGHIRTLLQASLLQRFLHYKDENRALVNNVQITMLIVRDVEEVVQCGYMKVLSVVKVVGKLLLALVFILAENKNASIPLTVFPFLLGGFLRCREKMTIEVNEKRVDHRNEMVQCVSDAINEYRHVADFALQSQYVERYTETILALNDSETAAMTVFTNNSFVAPWLTTVLIGAYIMYAVVYIPEEGLRIGLVLATINVFKEMGTEIQEIYVECLEIQKSFGALLKVSFFMNMETDLELRMLTNRQRRKVGKQLRDETSKELAATDASLAEGVFPVDHIPIQIKVAGFEYESAPSRIVLRNVNLNLPQGQLYAVVGPPNEGKATLLKLIGQVIVPQPDTGTSIFVPPHLRILHLSRHCSLMPGTFLDNVILSADLKKVGGIDRVTKICKAVGFGDDFLSFLTSADTSQWTARISDSGYQRLALARAFVMNPEVLVVHKPGATLTDSCEKLCIGIMKQHVTDRGLFLNEDERKFRRPRTVIYTATSSVSLQFADQIIEVRQPGQTGPGEAPGPGASIIKKEDVTMANLQ